MGNVFGIPGMGSPPGLYTLHIGRAFEVVLVLGFKQPTALAGGFTGTATSRCRAITLMSSVTDIRTEYLMTMQALNSSV